jgi:hypothetical protein
MASTGSSMSVIYCNQHFRNQFSNDFKNIVITTLVLLSVITGPQASGVSFGLHLGSIVLVILFVMLPFKVWNHFSGVNSSDRIKVFTLQKKIVNTHDGSLVEIYLRD